MAAPPSGDDKTCAVCGRRMEWRKRWARSWEEVRHCSERCRRRGLREIDRRLEAAIEELVAVRGAGKSICPSEAARLVGGERWQPLMQDALSAARRLAAAGRLEMLQRWRRVDPSTARGPVRLRGLSSRA